MKVRMAVAAVCVVGVLLVAGCAQIGLESSGSGSANSSAPTPVPVGGRAWAGDWSIVVKGERRLGTLAGANAGKGKQLLLVTFELMNGSASSAQINASEFTLTDETEARIPSLPSDTPQYLGDSHQSIAAGSKRTFEIVYRVQTGSGPFVWWFRPPVEGQQPTPAVLVVR